MRPAAAGNGLIALRLEPLGQVVQVRTDLPLLAGARAAGVELPSSCRNGTCRACMVRLTQGQVHYRIEWPGLSAEEKQQGCILPCVAYADDDVVVHAPGARRIDLGPGTGPPSQPLPARNDPPEDPPEP